MRHYDAIKHSKTAHTEIKVLKREKAFNMIRVR